MLSQIRWMLGMAIGVAIIVAVWLEPEVRDLSGEPAVPRQTLPRAQPGPGVAATNPSSSVRWQQRLKAYWTELEAALTDPGNAGADPVELQEGLRARHFSVEERPLVRALDANREP